MSSFLDEATLEQAVLALFGELGYQTVHGPTIGPSGDRPERATYAVVILENRLRPALQCINPSLPSSAIDAAIGTITRYEGGTLLEENRRLHGYIVNGVSVEYAELDGRPTHGLVRLFDFDNPDNNDWLAVNQFTVAEHASGKPHPDRRPDVVVFVNGLPLALWELKNPADTQATLKKAFGQLQTYKQGMPDLFHWNALLVVSDGGEARLGTISCDWERFSPWKTIDGNGLASEKIWPYEVLLRGVFDKSRLLDLVRGFIVFDDGPHALIKKVAAYHQYHAVKKAVARTVEAVKHPKDHRVGVVWHTQGSGKSLTMVFYAGQLVLHPDLKNPTLVFITDRNDLDGQLYQNFVACQDLVRQEPRQAESADDVLEKLSVVSGGVVFSTIQLFRTEEGRHPVVSERGNVVVIADEAHRSQYGLQARVDKESGEVSYGFARHLRDALPNAAFVGFTGTPIETGDKITTNVFGEYIDVYDIKQAVEDGATVPIYYESRLARLKLDEVIKEELNESFDLLLADTDDPRDLERIALEKLVGADERVERVAGDIVKHFEDRTATLPGKGMIVAISRRVCVALYREIVKLRPDWHGATDDTGRIKVIMTGSASDDESYHPHIRPKSGLDRIAERFKNAADTLHLVIVCDMWLTGFDAPCVHTMYLDKPLKAHGLMQAIARVNRVYGNKPSGLVVDYLGLAAELRAALHHYAAGGGRGKPTFDQAEAIQYLQEKLEVVRAMLHGLDYEKALTGTATERLDAVRRTWDHLAKPEHVELKQRFLRQANELYRGLRLAAGSEEAKNVDVEVGFFMAVRAMLVKAEGGGGKATLTDLDGALQQLVSRALVSEEVVDVFAIAGLKKPDVSILNEEFLAELRNMPQRNMAVEMLQRLLRDEIHTSSKSNVVRGEQFTRLLEDAVARYQNRSIEAALVIEEMLVIARQIRESNKRASELGLSEEEVAFYDALGVDETAESVLSRPVLCELARELVKSIRSSVTIDWTIKETVRAEIRTRIKRLLRRFKYPPGKQDEAVDVVLKQAELLCGDLTQT
jgi:type I restriction enzyme, R subunit